MTDRRPDGGGGPAAKPSSSSLTVRTATGTGGAVMVASDKLLSQLDALGRLADNLMPTAGDLVGSLDRFDPSVPIEYGVPTAALEAHRIASTAVQVILAAQDRAERLRASVRACLTEYSQTEQAAIGLSHRVSEDLAWFFGAGAGLFGLPVGLDAVGGFLLGGAMTGRSPSRTALLLQDFLKTHGRILTNPATVAAIRELASDADGIGEGYLLLPPPVADELQTTGATGVSTSANTVVALGRDLGLFERSGVAVRKTSNFEYGTPPTSLTARAESFPLPGSDPNGEQIRIDRYVEAGKPDRFDVFIAGTVTFDPVTANQPFDLSSDLNGVGQQSSASYEAVVQAMNQAGITAHSPVVVNGYSQGGLLASMVAASGKYNVQGVVTFGAPSSQVHIPASVPVLSVRNTEDLVPATSGYDVNPNALVVERPAFANQPVPSDWAVPAHRLSYYQQTAAVVDEAKSTQVRAVLDPLNQFGAGATRVDSTLWLATRVPTTG
ncbi:MAG TPA: hypothetical protein VHZ98_03110 [Galbitalea sp.]|nr:hypothetical protein [Galbitalea sp.]